MALISASFGLALFLFLSGYSLMINRQKFEDLEDLRSYLFKRFKAIFPIYWLALFITFISETVFAQSLLMPNLIALNSYQWLAYISGLQMLFLLILPEGLGLFWFVGVIVIFYLLFPVMIYFTSISKMSFKVSIYTISAILLLGLMAITYYYGLFGTNQIYFYYWFFISGILAGHEGKAYIFNKLRIVELVLLIPTLIVITYVMLDPSMPMFEPIVHLFPNNFSINIWEIIIGTIGLSIAFPVTRLLIHHFGTFENKMITTIAKSTYSVYLFHLYFLYFAMVLAGYLGPEFFTITVLFVGVPMALIFSTYIQNGVYRLMTMLRWPQRRGTM